MSVYKVEVLRANQSTLSLEPISISSNRLPARFLVFASILDPTLTSSAGIPNPFPLFADLKPGPS